MGRPPKTTPDTIFPSTNALKIPDLLLKYQGDFPDAPVRGFGELSRSSRHRGTYHFFVPDEKFQGVWSDPGLVYRSACPSVCEVNYSTNEQMPLAVALYDIYRKRWLSRLWQGHGLRVWVDLYVNPEFDKVSLLGVPKGWQAYATRTVDSKIEDLERSIHRARKHAQGDIRLLVVGGAKETTAFCARHGYHHVADPAKQYRLALQEQPAVVAAGD